MATEHHKEKGPFTTQTLEIPTAPTQIDGIGTRMIIKVLYTLPWCERNLNLKLGQIIDF